ncbi:MAG TPA: VCBS repeat-containing protein, partial [Candidatus Polarisedimenticolia bacterium]|nr:VCBS repeat-containing protein [Candidatus Polarisedimenticolia bacterium]
MFERLRAVAARLWTIRAVTTTLVVASMYLGIAVSTAQASPNWTLSVAGDFTGDGRSDIAQFDSSTGQWWVRVSAGSSFTSSVWATWNNGVTWGPVLAGDFNGDGKADIAGFDANSGQWWVGLSNGGAFATTLWATWSKAVTW